VWRENKKTSVDGLYAGGLSTGKLNAACPGRKCAKYCCKQTILVQLIIEYVVIVF